MLDNTSRRFGGGDEPKLTELVSQGSSREILASFLGPRGEVRYSLDRSSPNCCNSLTERHDQRRPPAPNGKFAIKWHIMNARNSTQLGGENDEENETRAKTRVETRPFVATLKQTSKHLARKSLTFHHLLAAEPTCCFQIEKNEALAVF